MRIIDDDFLDVSSVCAIDINGDEHADVLGAAYQDDEITWWENTDGFGTTWIEHAIDGDFNGARCVHGCDLNGDGIADVVGAANLDDDITWWQNTDGTGTSWIEHTITGSFESAYCVGTGDVDGDGFLDVIGSSSYPGRIAWWRNLNGSGTTWDEYWVDTGHDHARSIFPDDIDNDGDLDVTAAYYYPALVVWWENANGLGTVWMEHVIDGDFDGAACVHSGDVDGDGDTDVISAAVFDWEFAWWENVDGSGDSWTKHVIDGDQIGAKSVFSIDLDNDGDLDVIGAAVPDFDVSWWENADGQGTAWVEHTVYGSFPGACCVYSEDIDGDGNMDILGGAEYDDDIAWWDLSEYPPEGAIESSILDIQCSPQWSCITWNSTLPEGTGLYLQYKSSDDPDDMGSWSLPVYEPSVLSGILKRYFIYRFVLQSSDPANTPSLHDVTLLWDEVGVERRSQPIDNDVDMPPVVPNPATGSFQVRYFLREPAPVNVSVFDLSGRLARRVTVESEAGEHLIPIDPLPPGVYILRFFAGTTSETTKLTVIE
jgi:hypothetical protein